MNSEPEEWFHGWILYGVFYAVLFQESVYFLLFEVVFT
jgi:hypothetical protein